MYIASAPDFSKGKLEIPNSAQPATIVKISSCIEDHESDYLAMLLGADLSLSLNQGLATEDLKADPPVAADPKWIMLRDKIKPGLLAWLYFNYRQENNTTFTAAGETRITKSGNENSEVVSPRRKMILVWNDMVDRNFEVQSFLKANYSAYSYTGLYHDGYRTADLPEIFVKINPIF